ncbi:MAG: hypothetical protein NWE94_02425, partial [Candidatus Bathyarchaeota archaeon]|nr:hypothetical protein [Candidatus Bathyarchaeota archaeon]
VDNENRTQFRGVTQYAVTKQHDASDAAMTGGKNRIDSEMQYYLNQTFNPWDFQPAVHKSVRMWGGLDVGPFRFTTNATNINSSYPTAILSADDSKTWTDILTMQWVLEIDDLYLTSTALNTIDNWSVVFNRTLNGWQRNFEVFKGATYTGSWDFQNLAPLSNSNVSVAISMVDIHWSVTNPTLRDLKVWELGFTATIEINVTYDATTDSMNITAIIDADPAYEYEGMPYIYTESQMGRYEWAIVGRDAQTVDSAGSALVAEAFGSLKETRVGIGGADMAVADVTGQMPFVVHKFGSGTAKTDYKDGASRAALKGIWCTYWPVAGSSIIGVGGPLANLFAYYANDWTDAFYGLEQFAGTAYSNKIVPITCWNRNWPGYTYNTYESSNTVGYAVIATHKDINGTVLFTVWGHWGRDTYYASLWLHGDEARGITPGIIELQCSPQGATAIILKINYNPNPYHPTYTIPEVLGTISERLWYHENAKDVTNPYKGGIHDP